jgi:hypothetical protein
VVACREFETDSPRERDPLRSTIRSYLGASRGRWDVPRS